MNPAGRHTIKFDYGPPHVIWAWLAMWLALAGVLVPSLAALGGDQLRQARAS